MSQRLFERKEIQSPHEISVRKLGTTKRFLCQKILNLGFGGISILSDMRFEEDEELDVVITTSSFKIKLIVAVRNISNKDDAYALGCEYITVSKQNLKVIYSLIK